MIETKIAKQRIRIAKDMLFRYSGVQEAEIGKYILLTNFARYLESFAAEGKIQVHEGSILRTANDPKTGVTMIQFNMGAPTAALVMDLLSSISPKAVLMLGLCGGLHRSLKIGEFVVPMAAIRNEGVSQHYMPANVPSLPTFKLQHLLASTLTERKIPYKTGVVHTTDYRFWEFNPAFREQLKREKALAIEMECSALFTVAFRMKVPIGALLLVSDLPMTFDGIKTSRLQEKVFRTHLSTHLQIGLATLANLKKMPDDINLRHFQW